jgi:uncharacterized protein YjbI with pentapeptide repeats
MSDASKSPIERIKELSEAARTGWFSLLGCLAFVAVTLLSIKHVDVLLDSRPIKLPVLQVDVPTTLFLALAPLVTTVLYFNLHLYLTKLWKAFKDAPTDEDLAKVHPGADPNPSYKAQLANFIPPWLVNDYALALKEGTECRDHQRTWLRNLLTLFTTWLAAPLLLSWIWCKALLGRDLLVSGVILVCFLATAAIGSHSWLQAQRRLKRRAFASRNGPALALVVLACFGIAGTLEATGILDGRTALPGSLDLLLSEVIIIVSFLATVAIGSRSWLQAPRMPARRAVGPAPAFVALACFAVAAPLAVGGVFDGKALRDLPDLRHPIAIDRQNLAGLSKDWQSAAVQRAEFRKLWCGNADVPAALCGNVPAETGPTNVLIMERRTYCATEGKRKRQVAGARDCGRFFAGLDRRFDADWAVARKATLDRLAAPDLSHRDLAGATAVEVKLAGARLEGTDLSGAELRDGLLEGALLKSANLDGAQAFFADLRLANLTWATLDEANLESANLEGAALPGATLRGAKLSHANLAAADLSGADLRGADLKAALLYRTRLDGAILAGADLRGAVGLTPAQLRSAVGSPDTRFAPAPLVSETPLLVQPTLEVATCWEYLPKPVEKLLQNPWLSADDKADIRQFVCGKEGARRTGTTVPPRPPAALPRAPADPAPGTYAGLRPRPRPPVPVPPSGAAPDSAYAALRPLPRPRAPVAVMSASEGAESLVPASVSGDKGELFE